MTDEVSDLASYLCWLDHTRPLVKICDDVCLAQRDVLTLQSSCMESTCRRSIGSQKKMHIKQCKERRWEYVLAACSLFTNPAF